MAHGRRSSLAVHLWHFQLRCGQEMLLGDLVMVSEAIQPEPGLLTLTRCPLRRVHNLKHSATISPVLFYCTLPFYANEPGEEAREWNIPSDIPKGQLIIKPPGNLQGGSCRSPVKAG